MATEPLELVIAGRGEPPVAYACAKCGVLFTVSKRFTDEDRPRKKDEASKHCDRTCECGNVLEQNGYLKCRPCLDKVEADKESARFTAAEKLSSADYDSPVYWEGHSGGMGDGFFSGVDEVLDYCEDEDLEPPEYVWACSERKFALNAERFLENQVESQQLFEDAFDRIGEARIAEMQAYFDKWAADLNLVSWDADYSRAVLLADAVD